MELRSFDGAVVLCQVENTNVQVNGPYFDRRYRSAFLSILIVGLAGLFGVPQNGYQRSRLRDQGPVVARRGIPLNVEKTLPSTRSFDDLSARLMASQIIGK